MEDAMTDLTPEFLAELKALADEARLPVHAFSCPASQAWDIPGICVCSPRHRKKMSVGIDTVRALVEGYERAQEYEAALQEILLAGELGPDSRLPEHFDYTSAPFMHETARKALEGSRE